MKNMIRERVIMMLPFWGSAKRWIGPKKSVTFCCQETSLLFMAMNALQRVGVVKNVKINFFKKYLNIWFGFHCFLQSGRIATDVTLPAPKKLRTVMVPYFDKEKCKKYYTKRKLTDRMVCAGYDNGENKGFYWALGRSLDRKHSVMIV